jgi:exopolysaccharide biosynthesis polyprenyl glycosylphosphotransferase
MATVRRQLLLETYELHDLLIGSIALSMGISSSYWHEGKAALNMFLASQVEVRHVVLFLVFLVLWHFLFSFFGLYQSRRFLPKKYEVFDILKATTLGTIVLSLGALAFDIKHVDNLFIGTFWISGTGFSLLSRVVLWGLLKYFRSHGINVRHVLIVGTNSRTLRFSRKLLAKPDLGYSLLGFVDNPWPGLTEFEQAGGKVVSDFKNFPDYLRQNVVDEVIIGLPLKSQYQLAQKIVSFCEEQGIMVRYLSSIFTPKLKSAEPEDLEVDSVITLYDSSWDGLSVFFKRLLDITLPLIFLPLLFPFFILVGLAIKLTSSGSVFFSQERLGINKRRFKLYKFRTMVQGAEKRIHELEHLNETDGPTFKLANDPRVTQLGRWLRKTSIDELPQLWNVFKGDMSLVGPRPLPVRDYQGFDQDWQRRRFSVKPGITCLWQISGRSSLSFIEWMELDMQYIDQWSFWLDIKILLMTIPAVLIGRGAH